MKDLVTNGQLRLKPLEHRERSGLHLCVLVVFLPVSESVNHVRHLVCAELLSEADVRAGHVHSQTVLHPLQERHPALTLLLEALSPQGLRLELTAPPNKTLLENNPSSEICCVLQCILFHV